MKKTIKITVFCLFVSLLMTACKKEETFTTFEPPVWKIDHSVGYYENMTAIVKIPNNLETYAHEDDMLAAFASDGTCRGVGQFINGAYHVSIKGVPEDHINIHFQYYSARNRYLYKTNDLFLFDANQKFGTVDESKEIPLEVVK